MVIKFIKGFVIQDHGEVGEMSGTQEPKGTKPLTLRGRNGLRLNVWFNEGRVTFKVTRRTENGFETVDTFDVDTDFFVFKMLEVAGAAGEKFCRLAEKLAEAEGEG